MMREHYNPVLQSWLKSNFKKTVRYIYSDLKDYPEMFGINKHEQDLLKRIIKEFKKYCVDLWNDCEQQEDFSSWQKSLDWALKVKWNVKVIWVESDDCQDPDWVYNSLHVDFADYDFQLKEQAYDDFLCCMCETHGRGYDYLDHYVKQCDEKGEELPF